jgi:YD repeat-containing protein
MTCRAQPLVRYAYTPRGELAAVYDRSGTPVRSFTYDEKHPGRMVAHHHAGGRPSPTATMRPGAWWNSATRPAELRLCI